MKRLMLLSLLTKLAMAQIPTATVNDYLREVRIFAQGSPEFSQIASKLGVDATLPTISGASLVTAIRNDSGGAVELRILFNVTKAGRTIPYRLEVGRKLAAGESTLAAPSEVGGALTRLMLKPGFQGLVTRAGTGGPQSLDFYQGATVTASIDSATLGDGRFIGADTQKMYADLVAEDTVKRKFFSDLLALNGETEAEITSALTARQAAANAAPPATTKIPDPERGLANMSVMQLQYFGMANLFEWATKENAALQSKPTLHK